MDFLLKPFANPLSIIHIFNKVNHRTDRKGVQLEKHEGKHTHIIRHAPTCEVAVFIAR